MRTALSIVLWVAGLAAAAFYGRAELTKRDFAAVNAAGVITVATVDSAWIRASGEDTTHHLRLSYTPDNREPLTAQFTVPGEEYEEARVRRRTALRYLVDRPHIATITGATPELALDRLIGSLSLAVAVAAWIGRRRT